MNGNAAGPWIEGAPPKDTPKEKLFISEYRWENGTLFNLGEYGRIGWMGTIRHAELIKKEAE